MGDLVITNAIIIIKNYSFYIARDLIYVSQVFPNVTSVMLVLVHQSGIRDGITYNLRN